MQRPRYAVPRISTPSTYPATSNALLAAAAA
jgi:hypothetical protein